MFLATTRSGQGSGPSVRVWNCSCGDQEGISKVNSEELVVTIINMHYRCQLSIVERCPYRIEQCKQALAALNTSLDREFQMEVWSCVNTQ